MLGNKGAATELLHVRRSIGKAQARRLAQCFRVPVDLSISFVGLHGPGIFA